MLSARQTGVQGGYRVGASSAWREQASSHGEELGADNWTQEERRVGDAVGGDRLFFSFCRLRFGAWAVVKNVTWHVRDQEAEKLREQAKCPISQRAAKEGTHKGK